MNELLKDIYEAAQDPNIRLGIGSGGDKYDREIIKADVVVLEGDDLVDALKKDGIKAAVRGALPASQALDEIKRTFDLKKLMRAALLYLEERPVWMATDDVFFVNGLAPITSYMAAKGIKTFEEAGPRFLKDAEKYHASRAVLSDEDIETYCQKRAAIKARDYSTRFPYTEVTNESDSSRDKAK